MKMMGSSPAGPMTGNLSVLERALSKKQKPMKKPKPRPMTQPDFAKNAGTMGVKY